MQFLISHTNQNDIDIYKDYYDGFMIANIVFGKKEFSKLFIVDGKIL